MTAKNVMTPITGKVTRNAMSVSKALITVAPLVGLPPNVKVEQLAEGGSARTPGSIVASSTVSGYRESAPSPMLPHGEPCTKRGHADYVGCSCLRQRAFRREPWGDATASRSWSRAQRLADDILK